MTMCHHPVSARCALTTWLLVTLAKKGDRNFVAACGTNYGEKTFHVSWQVNRVAYQLGAALTFCRYGPYMKKLPAAQDLLSLECKSLPKASSILMES
jgi:hypothetical protein